MNLELIDAIIETRKRNGARRVRAGRRELIHFFFALEQLLRAGVPVLDALADLRDSAANATLRALVASPRGVDRIGQDALRGDEGDAEDLRCGVRRAGRSGASRVETWKSSFAI